ncbi:MAG TPA: O-antigen ligase family protein [Oscillatoriaceae cyanobacterium]
MIVTRPSFRWITTGIWLMPISFAATAVSLMGAFWRELLLRWESREIGFALRTPVGWFWAVILGLSAVSTAASIHPLQSLFGWLGGLGYFITFTVATWTVNTPGRLKQLHKALFGLATAMAVFGLVVYAFNWHFSWHLTPDVAVRIGTPDRRINSVMFHPNLFAGFLVLALGAGLGLFHQIADWPRKAAYGTALGLVSLCLLLTASRAGWIGGAFLLVAYGVIVDRRWLLALLGGAVAAVTGFSHMIDGRLASLAVDSPGFDKYRLYAWASTLHMIHDRPLLGWGPGMWSYVYQTYRLPAETRHLPHAHDYYLQIAAEFGVPVMIALVLLVGWVCVTGWRATRRTQYHLPVVATTLAVAGYALVNLFDYTLAEGRNAMAFFLLVGGVEAARRMAIADRPPELRAVIPITPVPEVLPDDPRP